MLQVVVWVCCGRDLVTCMIVPAASGYRVTINGIPRVVNILLSFERVTEDNDNSCLRELTVHMSEDEA